MIHLRSWRHATVAGALLSGLLVTVAPHAAAAATGCDTWTGTVSSSWDVAGNWSAGVPTSAVAVCIPSGQSNAVDATGAERGSSLSIGAGAQVAVESGASLTLRGVASVAGTLEVFSSTATVAAREVHVLHHGFLIGTGRIVGNVRDDGSVQVLDGGSGVPLRVTGWYHQNSSGSLLLRDEGGTFTRLRARQVVLAGALDLLLFDALRPGTRYKIVDAGTIAGHFVRPAGYRVRYGSASVVVDVTPEIQLNHSRVAPGHRIEVAGASFGYLGQVLLHLDRPGGPVVGSTFNTSVGFFGTTARIPVGTERGRHELFAINTAYGYRAQAEFRVT